MVKYVISSSDNRNDTPSHTSVLRLKEYDQCKYRKLPIFSCFLDLPAIPWQTNGRCLALPDILSICTFVPSQTSCYPELPAYLSSSPTDRGHLSSEAAANTTELSFPASFSNVENFIGRNEKHNFQYDHRYPLSKSTNRGDKPALHAKCHSPDRHTNNMHHKRNFLSIGDG